MKPLLIPSSIYSKIFINFGLVNVPACREIILAIIEKHKLHTLRISRRIVEEVATISRRKIS